MMSLKWLGHIWAHSSFGPLTHLVPTHLGPWLIWAPTHLGPNSFGPRHVWAPTHLGPNSFLSPEKFFKFWKFNFKISKTVAKKDCLFVVVYRQMEIGIFSKILCKNKISVLKTGDFWLISGPLNIIQYLAKPRLCS